MKTGDILLFKAANDLISKMIAWGTSSEYTHVGLCISPNENIVVEAMATAGVRIIDTRNIKQPYDLYRVKKGYGYNLSGTISYLVSKLNTRSDYLGVAFLGMLKTLSAIGLPLKNITNNWQRDRDYFCSELVYEAFYNGGGLNIAPDVGEAAIASLGDIARSKVLELIANPTYVEPPLDLKLYRDEQKIPTPKKAHTETNVITKDIDNFELAEDSLSYRDLINKIFSYKHSFHLFIAYPDLTILDFLKKCNAKSDYALVLAALRNLIACMNKKEIKKILKVDAQKAVGSIDYLEKFLEQEYPDFDKAKIITGLRNINRICNGYPIHQNNMRTLQAYDDIGVTLPIKNYSQAWSKILKLYLENLEELFKIIK